MNSWSMLHPPEILLQLLQRFMKDSAKVKQIHSLLITNGHLFISEKWINTLLFNTLIRSYLNLYCPWTSIILFVHMLRQRALPNSHTFPSVLKATASLSHPYSISIMGSSLNGQCVKRGVLTDPFVRTSFLSIYSQIGDVRRADKVFSEIPQPCVVSCNAMLDAFAKADSMESAVSLFLSMPKRDVYSWTSVINGYMRSGRFVEAVDLFREMMADEDVMLGSLKPSEATFVSILSSCANLDGGSALFQGKQIHGYIIRNVLGMSVYIGTAVVAFYGRLGCLVYALTVFDSMAVKQVCTWNAMICSLASNGQEMQALDMFETMKSQGLYPNEVTFVGVLSACARTKLVDLGLRLFHSMSRDFDICPKMEHYGCIVDLLGRAGLLKEAYEFVLSMPFKADASVLGALLGACKVHGNIELGNEVGMSLLELQPNHCGRYVLLSSIYAEAGIWDHAAALRKVMAIVGIQKIPAFSIRN